MIKLIIAVVAGAVILITTFLFIDPNVKGGNLNNDSSDVNDTNKLSVSIDGEVLKVGNYSFEAGATFNDLIIKAGGLTTKADERCFYYETPLVNNMTYYIPSRFDASDVCNDQEIRKVNINEDDVEKLMLVSGFTSSIASSIVSYREANGPFTTIEALTEVYGIGNATYRKVRPYVILFE